MRGFAPSFRVSRRDRFARRSVARLVLPPRSGVCAFVSSQIGGSCARTHKTCTGRQLAVCARRRDRDAEAGESALAGHDVGALRLLGPLYEIRIGRAAEKSPRARASPFGGAPSCLTLRPLVVFLVRSQLFSCHFCNEFVQSYNLIRWTKWRYENPNVSQKDAALASEAAKPSSKAIGK